MKCPRCYCVFIVFNLISVSVLVSSDVSTNQAKKPNIIFILADDAGWNDFSFHGSPQIPTPNIDTLALNGVVLNSYYASPLCTPTRGAIVTGKHPIHLGLQHFVIMGASSGGLPLDEKLLPEYLKDQGYSTHLVGKWHLGHSRKEYTPTYRGFDSHFGYWLGKQDYYSHISIDGKDADGNGCWGYDFRNNTDIYRPAFGQYDTDLFTDEAIKLIYSQPTDKPMFLMVTHIAPHSAFTYDPLQAPRENINKFKTTIKDENRQKYAAMMDKLDESVGLLIEALSRKKMLSNSIIVFASDNGGAPEGYDLNFSSNWPLRGTKNTLWEGGTRVAAAVWSPKIKSRVSRDMMHAQDWLPTLYEASGGDVRDLEGIDGISMWKTFTEGHPSPRQSMLYNIDDAYNNSAVREGPWKLIQGNTSTSDLGGGVWDFWYGPSGRNDELPPLNLLVPKIASSTAAKAMAYSGVKLNVTRLSEMQQASEFTCDQSKEKQIPCNAYEAPCLFNVEDDPCELRNLASQYPDIVKRLQSLIGKHNSTAVPPLKRIAHPEAFPKNHGNVWTTWEDEIQTSQQPPSRTTKEQPANEKSTESPRSHGNGLDVNYWGYYGHQGPSHPSHFAIHSLVSPLPTTPYPKVTSSNPKIIPRNRNNNDNPQPNSFHSNANKYSHSHNSFTKVNDGHEYHFKIHRNQAWDPDEPVWGNNRPFFEARSRAPSFH